MNTRFRFNALRAVSIATVIAAAPFCLARKSEASSDPAAQALATRGIIDVSAAGPYVQRGTFQIQVSTKLGRPDDILADGTWLYEKRSLAGSRARGTLLIRFADGQVRDLRFATPSAVAALREAQQRAGAETSTLAATRK